MRGPHIVFLVLLGLLAGAQIVAVSAATFRGEGHTQARALLASTAHLTPPIVVDADLAHLPAPVQRWLRSSGAVGQPRALSVKLRQRGGLRTGPGEPYMPAEAEQYFNLEQPGFVWMVDVTMARFVPIVGRDTFIDGQGRMLIKVGGLATLADGTGAEFDQGAALRLLGEIVWFPSAALARWISWSPIDDHRSLATATFGTRTVSATWEFDEMGRPRLLTAQRYYAGESLETWVVPCTEWRVVRGIEIPVRGGAVWKLADGDFDYYQWEILDVEANPAELWE